VCRRPLFMFPHVYNFYTLLNLALDICFIDSTRSNILNLSVFLHIDITSENMVAYVLFVIYV
jgi:hypothetical protein